MDRNKCEMELNSILKQDPIVSKIISGLRIRGCIFDPRVRICTEMKCLSEIDGGYDRDTNQIVICCNNIRDTNGLKSVLRHELVHMYDFCAFKINFRDRNHLACTEIRASNLDGKCGFYDEWNVFRNLRKKCVLSRAEASVKVAANVDSITAKKHVDFVQDKCFFDHEPL